MSAAVLDVAEVRSELERIIREHPENRNPVNKFGACVYSAPDGSHCLIGQLAAELGWGMPVGSIGALKAAQVVGWPVTDAAALHLEAVQAIADRRDDTDAAVRWSSITLPPAPSGDPEEAAQ